jgi:MerC mercury resistance protein
MTIQLVTEDLIITPEQAITAGPVTGRLDWFGVLCSIGCAVHCAAMPVLVATLPSLTSLRWLSDPLFHQAVAVLCAVLVSQAIVPGYRKHRESRVLTLAGFGLGLLFIAAFILPDTCCSGSGQMSTSSDVMSRAQKIVLVSSHNSSVPMQLGSYSLEPTPSVCGNGSCQEAATFSRTLLTALDLEGQIGSTAAKTLIQAQPYLSPIGGLLLIFAHVMNIRLRCCRRAPCRG